MKITTIARVLILAISLCFITAIAQASVSDTKSAVIKSVPGTAVVAAMHETVIGIEGKLMAYEFYRHDTWSQKLIVPDRPRRRPEPAPI